MMHKKARKQFAEDKQTKDMDYWNHVLSSDETKIQLFGSDDVKRVWRQPGEEYKDKYVLPIVKHGGGSVMVWGCMSVSVKCEGCTPVRYCVFVYTYLYLFIVHVYLFYMYIDFYV